MGTRHHTGRARRRPRELTRLLLPLALLLLVPIGRAARGQDDRPPTPITDEPAPLTLDDVAARIAELGGVEAPDADQTAALESLKTAKGFLEAVAKSRAKQAEIEQLGQSGTDRLAGLATEQAEIDAALAAPLALGLEPVPSSATVDEMAALLEPIQARLTTATAQLEAAKTVSDDTDRDLQAREERQAKLPDDIAQAHQRLEEVQTGLASQPAAADTTIATTAQRDALEAEGMALEARIARLEVEVQNFDALQSLIQARVKRDASRVEVAKRLAERLQAEVDGRRTAIAGRTQEEAQQAQLAAANAHHVVQELLQVNAELTGEVLDVSAKNTVANERLQEIGGQLEQVRGSFESFKALVVQVGLTDVVGFRLRNQLAKLPSISELERQLRLERAEMQDAQSRRFDLDAMTFGDPTQEAERLLAESAVPVTAGRRDDVIAAAVAALEKQATYVAQLKAAYDAYYNDLNATLLRLHRAEQALVTLVTNYRGFIRERILWTQSADVLAPSDLMESVKGIGWLSDPRSWNELGVQIGDEVRANRLLNLLVLLPVPILLLLRRRMSRRLIQTGEQTRRISTDRFSHTLQAAVLTLLIALPWPSLLHIVAWRVGAAGDGATFAVAISGGLERVSYAFLWMTLLLVLCRQGGLGDAHFRWPPENLKLIRRHVRWLLPISVVLSFIIGAVGAEGLESFANSLGRFVFILGMVILAFFLYRILHPDHGLLTPIMARRHGGWLERLRHVWIGVIVGLPVVLALASIVGFAYTALHLSRALVRTTFLIVIAMALHALLMRWLFVTQRRLALAQALRRREAAAAAARERAEAEAGGEEPAPVPESEPIEEDDSIDVAAVSAQARRLVQGVVILGAFVGMFLIWSDVLPAFRFLQNVEVWPSQTEPAATVMEAAPPTGSGPGMADVLTPAPPAGTARGITVADLLTSLMILALMLITSRNIPGVLEITLLQRLPMTPGARYATSTMVRYALIILGIILAFDAIGIGWAKVQWLAAAVTVGLGFGLQEIFANFVSGLIILFERPVRIGDTVTVGAVSGTVSRIQMRATTITDWDRKEMIIPNKEFVTGQIMNWSLSESIIRARIEVGVAYGSDTKLAKRLLLEIAQAQPMVLERPEPSALFMGFGDSCLELELRAFIANVDINLSTKDAIHDEIDRLFKEHGIEIAFPQRDIHVRSIEAPLALDRAGEFRRDRAEGQDGPFATPKDPAD